MDEITFIIKTLERPGCLLRLVKSIYRYYPDSVVLIGDDSEVSCKEAVSKRYPDKNISVFELPHDCGLSFGRNFLVDKVQTKYFVLLDDDFVFDRFTDIEKALKVLEDQDMDILGGYFRNYPLFRTFVFMDYVKYPAKMLLQGAQEHNYIGYIEEQGDEVRVKYYTKRFPEFERVDLVHNFFIARTEVVRDQCRWDDSIKIHEHTPFFIHAKRQGLKVGFTNSMSVKHKPFRTMKYSNYRCRDYVKRWMKLYGFKRFVFTIDDDPEEVVFEIDETGHIKGT